MGRHRLQATGVAGWASAYYYATDPGLDRRIGSAVIEAANNDQAHLFAFLIPGALLVVLGTVLQCVGLFRAHVVPVWVPIALLFTVLTFIVPGNGALGLATSIPMAAGAIGLGYYLWRGSSSHEPRSRAELASPARPWLGPPPPGVVENDQARSAQPAVKSRSETRWGRPCSRLYRWPLLRR